MTRILRAFAKPFTKAFMDFWYWEASSGVVLMVCALLALIVANSPWSADYEHFLHMPIAIGWGDYVLELGLLHWINDGLMAIFFFVIGLEIKREFLFGELKTPAAMLLPVGAAVGGMVVPAVLYALVNYGSPTMGGWGIPMATDIAFALGIMTLAARSAPLGLVVFLTALAIVDDLGAIVVIAVFYSSELVVTALLAGIAVLAIAFVLNRLGVRFFPVYLLLGILAWLAFFKAGIHPTIAGVILGFAIPTEADPEESMLHKLEHSLEPWSAYAIMPIFALANAGVSISLGNFDFTSTVFWGILAGLCIGKPLGIFGAIWILNKFFKVPVPGGATTGQSVGTGMLGGIGFTMSIFIASLAFTDGALLDIAKISILSASLLSGVLGALVFQFTKSGNNNDNPVTE